jgi:hypothetical protein
LDYTAPAAAVLPKAKPAAKGGNKASEHDCIIRKGAVLFLLVLRCTAEVLAQADRLTATPAGNSMHPKTACGGCPAVRQRSISHGKAAGG